jgi:pyruvate formate lyase activating enzyme
MIDRSSTPVETLTRARNIGMREGLLHVYEGNVPGEGETTHCGKCDAPLIRRYGYSILENNVRDGACGTCREPLAGVWL